jgi:hypothetical protein
VSLLGLAAFAIDLLVSEFPGDLLLGSFIAMAVVLAAIYAMGRFLRSRAMWLILLVAATILLPPLFCGWNLQR